MLFKLRYYDLNNKEHIVNLEPLADVVTLIIPEQVNYCGQKDWYLPELTITINNDAVLISDPDHRIGGLEYSDLVGVDDGIT